jgi:hypothetical protein
MDWRKVLTKGDVIRVIASFLFFNLMFYLFIPLETAYVVASNLVLLLFLILFVVIRTSDDGDR